MGIQHKRKKNVNFQLVVVTRNNEIPEIIREIRSTGKHSREKKKAALIASHPQTNSTTEQWTCAPE